MLNKTRLLTPGPTPLPEEVRLALAKDMIHHRKGEFHRIVNRTQEQLKLLFGTEGPVLPLSCSGTGAMTAAVGSLFSPGDTVAIVNGGKFGERWGKIAASYGLECIEIVAEWGCAVTAEEVESVLDEHPQIKAVLVQLSETSTGVLHPIEDIAKVTRTRDTLLLVDGISGVGISPCPMDQWGIDCLVTGSQKGLMLPPGLAFLALSPRAWQICEQTKPACFYFNLPKEREKLAKGETNFTSAINLMVGLEVSLDLLLSQGLNTVYTKQWALTNFCRKSVQAMGLTPFARNNFTWGLTSVLLPSGIDGSKILAKCAEDFGVYMAGGQDALKGRIVRIGHMGWIDWADLAAGLYALNRTLIAAGAFCGSHDFLEQGLASYQAALQVKPGTTVPEMHN